MSEGDDRDGWITPIRVGVVLTALVFLGFAAMAAQETCKLFDSGAFECREKIEWLLDSPPNEIGDTIAGFAGALAFVWIVITVWLQSQELSDQRKEIREQRIATQEMAKTQAEQLKVLHGHAEILKEEQQDRIQMRVSRLLDNLVTGLNRQLEMDNRLCVWYLNNNEKNEKLTRYKDLNARINGSKIELRPFSANKGMTSDESIYLHSISLALLCGTFDDSKWRELLMDRPDTKGFAQVRRAIAEIADLTEVSDLVNRTRISSLKLDFFVEALDHLDSLDIWREQAQ